MAALRRRAPAERWARDPAPQMRRAGQPRASVSDLHLREAAPRRHAVPARSGGTASAREIDEGPGMRAPCSLCARASSLTWPRKRCTNADSGCRRLGRVCRTVRSFRGSGPQWYPRPRSLLLIVGHENTGELRLIVQPAQPAAQFLADLGCRARRKAHRAAARRARRPARGEATRWRWPPESCAG